MKYVITLISTLSFAACAFAGEGQADKQLPSQVCLFAGVPSQGAVFEEVKRIKVAKGSYGSVSQILPELAAKAQSMGANGVVHYMGSQRFGFWPWRIVRPVVRGTAVKVQFKEGQSCADLGGKTVGDVIKTNVAPT
ncbi:hypothetical protein PVT67_16890 [Gallaecimonas kandeliae]|uniref:hypothetical protein n=1 Tax=Gallaecimonas kandeliae TaxID=3029055 RepID=UPI00264A3C44|nr:hypothetical protein [Gallaecimonas kandeliae]WKE65319.1 hypothetical protein PVT67_16890 [Gallaecimonas kandeliae]